jgi:pimeloyl-ACP methyl ester carboxylesterase
VFELASESRADARTPEAVGEFVVRIMEAFGLDRQHVIAPDIGTPACLFAAANHPGVFKSLVIGSGATDHTDILGVLDQIVNAPSLEPFKDLTGEQFVREAVAGMKATSFLNTCCRTISLPTQGKGFGTP